MVDLDALLAETKDLPPCGPNLEHDLLFFELDEAARGKAEQRIGDTVKPAEDPNWSKVLASAEALLGRSKDLRIALHLSRALTRTEGIPGLAAGLRVIHGLLEQYWDGVHPRLDPDDDQDPTERLNALAPLTDPETVLRDVRDSYLVDTRQHGQLQAREAEIALGRLAPSGTAATTLRPLPHVHALLGKAFAQDRAVPAALRDARDRVVAIQTLVSDRVGDRGTCDLKPLVQCLDNLLEVCDTALGTPAGGPAGAASSDSGAALAAGAGAGALALGGQLRSREDAVRVLDLVCDYLERHEPSNPAPLFIRRAQRLMTKNFVEIVKDLLPDSLSSLERLAGDVEPK